MPTLASVCLFKIAQYRNIFIAVADSSLFAKSPFTVIDRTRLGAFGFAFSRGVPEGKGLAQMAKAPTLGSRPLRGKAEIHQSVPKISLQLSSIVVNIEMN
jgi:hypothetical protein